MRSRRQSPSGTANAIALALPYWATVITASRGIDGLFTGSTMTTIVAATIVAPAITLATMFALTPSDDPSVASRPGSVPG